MFPEILLDINRIDVKSKEVFLFENEWYSNDFILFDAGQAKKMVKQYSRFEYNFSDFNNFEILYQERVKNQRTLDHHFQGQRANQSLAETEKYKKDWIANYFFPVSISHIVKGLEFYFVTLQIITVKQMPIRFPCPRTSQTSTVPWATSTSKSSKIFPREARFQTAN